MFFFKLWFSCVYYIVILTTIKIERGRQTEKKENGQTLYVQVSPLTKYDVASSRTG